jgi:glutamate racemase
MEASMAEILGLGCTHYPGLLLPDERLRTASTTC